MSENSSFNNTILHFHLPSNNLLPLDMECYTTAPGSFIYTAYTINGILLILPLSIFIIHHGLQQWRQQRSTSSAATMSHSDCFTYHMVIIELSGLFGDILRCCGVHSDHLNIALVGYYLMGFTFYGEMFFHVLTCVEHYLAVVHPITYLSLRNERGIRIRNVTIGCVWLLGLALTSLMTVKGFIFVDLCTVVLSFTVVSFCSVSVLCALIRPGPGEQGGDRERVDQSKQRAFYTIMAILGVLVVRFAWSLVWAVLFLSEIDCAILASCAWFNLPSALVLPLLFLHRAGKLVCCKTNIK